MHFQCFQCLWILPGGPFRPVGGGGGAFAPIAPPLPTRLSLSVSFLLPSYEEIPPESLPAFDTISSPKSNMPASEPFVSKGTVEHTSNCEFLLKMYHFPSFWKSLSLTKLTYTPTLYLVVPKHFFIPLISPPGYKPLPPPSRL